MDTITLIENTKHHPKGSVLRVWRDGMEVAEDVVDPQRAKQWIEDEIAIEGRPQPRATRTSAARKVK